MVDEVDEAKKLTVEERIQKLKEIEKKNKDEIKKAQDLLKESEEELIDKDKKKAKIPIPQLKAVDISELFSEEEKQMFKSKRFDKEEEKEEKLEETVETEEKKLPPEQIEKQQQYQLKLSKEPMDEIYNQLKNIYQSVNDSGSMTGEQRNQINNIEYAVDKKQQDINAGEYNPSEYVANKIIKTQQIGEELKKKYQGK